jgi:hypothetical protein
MFDQGIEIMLPVGMKVRDLYGREVRVPFDQMGKVISVARESGDTALVRGMKELYVVRAEQLLPSQALDFEGAELVNTPAVPAPVVPKKRAARKPRKPDPYAGRVDEDVWPLWTQRGRDEQNGRLELEAYVRDLEHPPWKRWLNRIAIAWLGGSLLWLFFSGRLVAFLYHVFGG